MRHPLITVLAAVLTAPISANLVAAPAAPVPHVHVLVRVFDTSAQPMPQLQTALDEAAALMRRASVQVDWRICQAAGSVFPCFSFVSQGERVLRIVSSPPGPVTSGRLPLGNAILDPATGTGVLATAYFDRVMKMSLENACDQDMLLGRTISHELGHLLLGTNAHSRTGLMRGVWTTEELRLNRPQDWRFSEVEAATMGRRNSEAGQAASRH